MGIPRERCREIMRGTMILASHPDAEAFALSLYRDEQVSEVLAKYEKEKWLYTRACIVAGEVGYTWLSGVLYQALGHEDPEIICGAAEGLAGLGEKRAIPVCMRLAEAEPNAYFRVKLWSVYWGASGLWMPSLASRRCRRGLMGMRACGLRLTRRLLSSENARRTKAVKWRNVRLPRAVLGALGALAVKPSRP
jgi:hypothetical protein